MNSEQDKRNFSNLLSLQDSLVADTYAPSTYGPSILCKTTVVSVYPTTAISYYATLPQSIFGTETEGANAVILSSSDIVYALNIGSTVPPIGTYVLLTYTGNRWVFRYDA